MGLADLIRDELERQRRLELEAYLSASARAARRQRPVRSWLEREAALEAVRRFDVERGYRAPSEWDHVHQVERDAPPTDETFVMRLLRDQAERSTLGVMPPSSPADGCLGG